MKKITLLAAILVASISAKAQNFYTFTKSEATYEDLTDAVSINNGEVWLFLDQYGPFETPFPIYIFGQEFNQFAFTDSDFTFFDMNEGISTFFYPLLTITMDKGYPESSQSPVSYKVEGEEGSRILKLELQNAALVPELIFQEPTPTLSTFLNYQIWFYEADNSIEYHYGDHNITDLTLLNDEGMPIVILELYNFIEEETERAGLVTGAVENPVYMEFASEEDFPDNPEELLTLDDIPQPNTVYRFELNPASVDGVEKPVFSIYPNPATEIVNLSFYETIYTEYAVYDMTGRNILSGTINGESNKQISVESLQSGTYVFKVGNTTKKFIKK